MIVSRNFLRCWEGEKKKRLTILVFWGTLVTRIFANIDVGVNLLETTIGL